MNEQLVQTVKQLIHAGCHYELQTLATLYHQDLKIIILNEKAECLSFDYDANMQFFANLKQTGAPPLDTTAVFNYAEVQDGIGFVSVTRQLDLGFGKKKIIFHLMLKQTAKQWQIFREQAVIIGDA